LESSRRKRIVAVALIGAALVSFALAGFSLAASSSAGQYKTGVFAKVYGFGEWITITLEWQTLLSLELPYVPTSAYYHVVCDGFVNTHNGELEIAIGVDSLTHDESTRRFYYGDLEPISREMLTGMHTERVYYLDPGQHAFYFLGRNTGGSGVPRVNYHTITVTVFTDGSLVELTGTAEGNVAPDGSS